MVEVGVLFQCLYLVLLQGAVHMLLAIARVTDEKLRRRLQ